MATTFQRTSPAAAPAPSGRSSHATLGQRGRTLVIVTSTAVLILAAAALTNLSPASAGVTPVNLAGVPTGPAPIVGQPAPDFTATTVDGKPLQLADFKGSVVWLTFGASWCQPCRSENPDIKAAAAAFADRGVVVVQIFINEDAASVADYSARLGLTHDRIADISDVIASNYRILGIPAHFFIDRDGVLRQMRVGTLDAASMQAILTDLAG
jgi:cytochrome c biogenesis protein CcmG/thiol:disulfide interchange protein DsbE